MMDVSTNSPIHNGNTLRRRSVAMAAVVCVTTVILGACGASHADTNIDRAKHSRGAGASAHHEPHERGAIKPNRWSIIKVKGRSVRLFAFVPYCGHGPKPHVERVTREQRPKGLILTMFVWYPPKYAVRGCYFLRIGIMSAWISVGKAYGRIQLYDGKTSPPELRPSPKHGFP